MSINNVKSRNKDLKNAGFGRKDPVSRFGNANARPSSQLKHDFCDFSITYLIFPAALSLGVYSASNRNEYYRQETNSGE
jgi:hypothetical protein